MNTATLPAGKEAEAPRTRDPEYGRLHGRDGLRDEPENEGGDLPGPLLGRLRALRHNFTEAQRHGGMEARKRERV